MEVNGKMKLQMMSLAMLLIFSLMLSELFFFVILNINSNSLAQSRVTSTSSSGLKTTLQLSASTFGNQSASAALSTLTQYEYTPTLRHGNFITNLSAYMSDLMINGTLPDVSPGSKAANMLLYDMGALTFKSYNASITSEFNNTISIISINETKPVVTQTNPYTLSIIYSENVKINTGKNMYQYGFPVNATIALNGTEDLLYAQQSILRKIQFTNINNLSQVVGNAHANSGSFGYFVYGTIWNLPNGSTSCSGVPNTNFIIAIPDSATLGSCYNNYEGLITYQVSGTPTVPYLVYNSTSNIINDLPTGTNVALYGPGLVTLSIENLRKAITNQYFIPSPLAPSYTNRAEDNLFSGSPYGSLTFTGANRQVAYFNGASSYINTGNFLPLTSNSFSVSFWVKEPTSISSWTSIVDKGRATTAIDWYFLTPNTNCGNGQWVIFNAGPGELCYNWGDSSWHFVVGTYNSSGTLESLYVDGVLKKTKSGARFTPTSDPLIFGARSPTPASYFSGYLSNIQIYNTSLSRQQVDKIYSEGITGLPTSNSGLVGWWPLDGNANDYSGYNNNGTVSNIAYTGVPQGSSSTSVGSFNGGYSYISGTAPSFSGDPITVSAWINPQAEGSTRGIFFFGNGCSNGETLALSGNQLLYDQCGNNKASGMYIPTNSWSFVGYTLSGNTITFYYNNTNTQLTLTSTPTITSTTYAIGNDLESVYPSFNGSIANVQVYDSVLSTSQMSTLYQAGVSGGPINTQNLEGWWPLSGTTNDNSNNVNPGVSHNASFSYYNGSAEDSLYPSGIANNVYPIPGILSCTGVTNCFNGASPNLYMGTYPITISNQFLQAAKFNGVNSKIMISEIPQYDISGSLTETAWIYLPYVPSSKNYAIVAPGSTTDTFPLLFLQGSTSDVFSFAIDSGGTEYAAASPVPKPGRWYFVAGTYNQGTGTVSVYVNGVQYNCGTCPASSSTQSQYGNGFALGAFPSQGTYTNASIADVQIYNASLDYNSINELYSEGIGGMPANLQNLVAWWPLNGNCHDNAYSNSCIYSQNVGYTPIYGMGSSTTGSLLSGIENGWQALGFGTYP